MAQRKGLEDVLSSLTKPATQLPLTDKHVVTRADFIPLSAVDGNSNSGSSTDRIVPLESLEVLITNLEAGYSHESMIREFVGVVCDHEELRQYELNANMFQLVGPPRSEKVDRRDYLWLRYPTIEGLTVMLNALCNYGFTAIWSPQSGSDKSRTLSIEIAHLGLSELTGTMQSSKNKDREVRLINEVKEQLSKHELKVLEWWFSKKKDYMYVCVDWRNKIENACESPVQLEKVSCTVWPPRPILPSHPFEIVIGPLAGQSFEQVMYALGRPSCEAWQSLDRSLVFLRPEDESKLREILLRWEQLPMDVRSSVRAQTTYSYNTNPPVFRAAAANSFNINGFAQVLNSKAHENQQNFSDFRREAFSMLENNRIEAEAREERRFDRLTQYSQQMQACFMQGIMGCMDFVKYQGQMQTLTLRRLTSKDNEEVAYLTKQESLLRKEMEDKQSMLARLVSPPSPPPASSTTSNASRKLSRNRRVPSAEASANIVELEMADVPAGNSMG